MLNRWPEPAPESPDHQVSDACRRLRDASAGLVAGTAGWRDVACLMRQVLLTAHHTYPGDRYLVVPATPDWPTVDQWDVVECLATHTADGRLVVRAREWTPPSTPTDRTVGAAAAAEQVGAVYRDVEPAQTNLIEADPFWRAAHRYSTYRGETQRSAARAAVLTDEGSLVIALPTGRGKTAVAWSKVLLSQRGVTIVVVPTVVLALDMERRTREAAHARGIQLSPVDRYAYVGSLDPTVKKQLRDAVRSGGQRILYASPEAFVTGLAPAVRAAAASGFLQQVVIDEAHLVDQWGTDFRPEFQTMPGLISDAYRTAPDGARPSVLLMSATLAQRPLTLLRELFSVGPNPAGVVWGSELRSEPAYFISSHDDETERQAAVLKAVSSLPRPLILYTTKVNDAEAWAARLHASGLRRVGTVTGKSSDEERRTAMDRWRGTAVDPTACDIVVGTSAFGLGLDMPNVRTVIHACLPETIDRYYQEVGRAGRDGRPSIAYLCIGPGDRQIAEHLSEVTMISNRLGWKRWQALLRTGVPITTLRFRVRKSALPEYMEEGYGQSAQWNVRTLTLMAQAGIIDLRVPQWLPNPNQSDEEQERSREAFDSEVEDYIEFEFRNGEYLSESGWASAMDRVRHDVRSAQRSALNSIVQLSAGVECVGRQIAAHYRVHIDGGQLVTQPACRGCPSCRRNPDTALPAPREPIPVVPTSQTRTDALAQWRGEHPTLFIWHEDGEDTGPLLTRMAQRRLSVFSGLTRSEAERLQRSVANSAIILDDPQSLMPLSLTYEGPIVCVLKEPAIDGALIEREQLRIITYIVGPKDTPNPDRPGWSRRDGDAAISTSSLLKGL
ncbi:MAG TPA: protein DpdF [Propionicimonas sp.]